MSRIENGNSRMTDHSNPARFSEAARSVIGIQRAQNGIGTLSEKTMHAVFKNYFQPHADSQEIKVGDFVADIVGENGIIEIQTKQLSKLAKKLDAFLPCCAVTVVHPIIAEKNLIKIDEASGEVLSRRKSPKKQSLINIFDELYSLRNYITDENFSLCVCMIKADVIKNNEQRRYKVKKLDTVPTELLQEVYFHSPRDYLSFIPNDLPDEFTSAQFAKLAKTDRSTALSCLNTLTAAGLIKRVGKQKSAILFSEIS